METEDTIVTDVIEEPKLSQREQAMQSILASTRGEQEDDIVQPEPEPDNTQQDDEFIIKIDGTEDKVPKDKVIEAGIRALQKESTADKRLYEVSAKEQALKRREEELARMEQDLIAKRDQQPDEDGREFVDAIFTDPDTAAAKIATLARQVQTVTQKVEQREKIEVDKQQSEVQTLAQHYHANYQDIATDPDMHFSMNRLLKQVAAEKPELSKTQVIDETAKLVYTRFGRTPAGTEPPPQTPAEKRQQAKQNMPAPVKRASARTEPPPTEKPKTPAQVIDEMRKGRGPSRY